MADDKDVIEDSSVKNSENRDEKIKIKCDHCNKKRLQ